MKKIDAIIRSEKLPEVKEALKSLGISGMTVYSVSGWSRGKEEHLQWKGQPVVHDLIAKSKVEVIVPDSKVDAVIDTVTKNARTGMHGDGIIFVVPIEQVVNIMTMDKDEKVVT
ncbi:MAG: P-II family nitrogen regulator [Nitrososphaera sp.]|nr:P-II family nitrogen regulator [Nitrososphaera sp.]